MTKKQKIFIFGLVLIALCGNLFFVSKIKADDDNLGQKISEQKIFFGTHDAFILTERLKDNQKTWILTETSSWQKYNLKLAGFEDKVVPCSNPIYKMNDVEIGCLKGVVGVHSENYVFFDINKFEPINFVGSDANSRNVYSDVPAAKIDGSRLAIDQRNYDSNPLTDVLRYYFEFNDGKFTFDKKINITYDEKNSNFIGDL